MEHYKQMKVSTLKNIARERGLRRYSKLRKSELIELIKNPPPPEYTKTNGERERFTTIL